MLDAPVLCRSQVQLGLERGTVRPFRSHAVLMDPILLRRIELRIRGRARDVLASRSAGMGRTCRKRTAEAHQEPAAGAVSRPCSLRVNCWGPAHPIGRTRMHHIRSK
jgi:hypothetical protein